jgi:SAM-dependent methyltransferase
MKGLVVEALRRAGLLKAGLRAHEGFRALTSRGRRPRLTPDGLPLPSPRLMVMTAGTADPDWFLESGRRSADSVRETLAHNGVQVETFRAMLDFGCGCGRVLRHWARLRNTEMHGSDYNLAPIRWCRRALPFARFTNNGLRPPLPFPDARFDFAYALSVFTHLPPELERTWMAELRRVVRPGGYLLITTHGEHFMALLTAAERDGFLAGRAVVRCSEVAGTNLCVAYHPAAYVRRELASRFEVVEEIPEGARGNPGQDVYLLRRPP